MKRVGEGWKIDAAQERLNGWQRTTGFDRRFLMKRVGEGWKIDAAQERLNGWQRMGL